MKALIPQATSEKTMGTQKGGAFSSGNALMQGSAGPTALAAPSIYEVLAMYNKIISLDQKQQSDMLKAQTKEAQGQAKATEKAALWIGGTMIAAGALSIGGAALGMYLGNKVGSDEYNQAGEDLQSSEGDMQSMKSLDTWGQEAPIAEKGGSDETSEGNSDENPQVNPDVIDRKNELLQGKYPKEMNDENEKTRTKSALSQLKAEPEEYARYQDRLQDRMETKSRDINSSTSKMLRVNNSRQMAQSMSQEGVKAVSSSTQGVGNLKQGEYKASEALNQTASSLANSRQQTNGNQMEAAIQSAQKQTQTLLQIRNTNKGNQ